MSKSVREKLTESDRKLFRKAMELELQPWLDHQVFDLVKKKFVDQESVMRARRQKHVCVCWAFRIQN